MFKLYAAFLTTFFDFYDCICGAAGSRIRCPWRTTVQSAEDRREAATGHV